MEGNEINVIAEKQENEFIVKTYVNDELVDSATREILSDGSLDDNIVYVKYYNESDKTTFENSIYLTGRMSKMENNNQNKLQVILGFIIGIISFGIFGWVYFMGIVSPNFNHSFYEYLR